MKQTDKEQKAKEKRVEKQKLVEALISSLLNGAERGNAGMIAISVTTAKTILELIKDE